MANILITGATGAVGRFVVQHLLAEGHTLRLLARNPHAIPLHPNVTVYHADLSQPHTLNGASAEIDIVVHLAAMLHINQPSDELLAQYRQVNVTATKILVEDALRHQVRRFVFASTINVYGPTAGGKPFTETSPLNPDSIYAETKIEAENALRGRIPHVILRLAAVYGRQMNGNYPRLVRAIGKRRFAYIGDGGNRRALIHERDVAAAVALVMNCPEALNQTFNLTDGQPHTLRHITEAIAVAQDVAAPSIHLPAKPLRLGLGLVEDAARFVGVRSPLGRAVVDKMMEDVAISSDKIAQLCGFTPQMTLAAGWADACQQ